MAHEFESILGILSGLGLAAACGFRIFVPMLIAAIAVRSGTLSVAQGFEWIGSTPAILAFGVATTLEIGGYYLPGLDHFLDVVATPAAVVAGTLVCASFLTDVDPWFRWCLAVVAGGGIAGTVQLATLVTRGASGLFTFGIANPIVATGELVSSVSIAAGVVLGPVFLLCALALVGWMGWRLWSRRAQRPSPPPLPA